MSQRRSLASAGLTAAALLPPVLWLWPAIVNRQAPSFRDQGDFFFPLKVYTADRLSSGSLPLWNPLSGTGEPWLANAQSGVFYPPSWLFLIPSAALAAALYLLLHFGLAAWGAWRFLKDETVSDAAALFGAAALVGCGFAASLSAYWNHFGAWAYLPAAAALARSGLPTRASTLALAGVLGLQAMAGSPEISGATVLLAALLLFFPRHQTPEPIAPPPRRRRFLRLGGSLLLAFALAAWVLVPLAELILNSDRRASPPGASDTGAVTLRGLASLVGFSPGASGTPYLASLLATPLLLFAAAAAPLEPERRRLVLLLAAIGAAGVLTAAAGPPGAWIRRIPPLDRIRYPAKALSLTFFSLAMLAGLGVDSLRFLRARGRGRLVLAAGGVAALALLLLSPVPVAERVAGAVGTVALLLLCLLPLKSYSVSGTLAVLAAVSLAAALALAGRPLFRFAPEGEVRREPPAIDRLREVNGRILTPPMAALAQLVARSAREDPVETLRRQREALLGYTNLLFRVPTIRTAAALPTASARMIADSIDASPDPADTAGRAGARALWTPFRPVRLPSRKVEDFFRAPLERYRPRVTYARAYRVERDPARAWRLALAPGQSPGARVTLDREPEFRPAPAERPMFVARLSEDSPERVTVEMTANSPGLLVLADLYYPGWAAEADGRPVDLLRADGVFRAVSLPAGSHRVVFRYRPVSFYAGAALSGAALLALLVLLWRGEKIPVGRRR